MPLALKHFTARVNAAARRLGSEGRGRSLGSDTERGPTWPGLGIPRRWRAASSGWRHQVMVVLSLLDLRAAVAVTEG